MLEKHDEYMKEIRAKYENVPEDRLPGYWRSDILSCLSFILHFTDYLKTVDFPGENKAEILELLGAMTEKSEKAVAEINFIVQFIERLQEDKSNHAPD